MRVVGSLVMSRQLFKRVLFAQLRRVRRYRMLGGVVVALALLALWGSPSPLSVGLLAAGLVIVFLPEVLFWLGWRRLKPVAAQPWRYEITDQTVTLTTALITQQVRWDRVARVDDRADFWVLRSVVKGFGLVVVKSAFTAADQAEVDAFLAVGVRP
jgi:hypothetical protein